LPGFSRAYKMAATLTALSPCVILCIQCSVIFGHCSTIGEILLSTWIIAQHHSWMLWSV
jgi:hypothetical protein